jgi:hypothetical protein
MNHNLRAQLLIDISCALTRVIKKQAFFFPAWLIDQMAAYICIALEKKYHIIKKRNKPDSPGYCSKDRE